MRVCPYADDIKCRLVEEACRYCPVNPDMERAPVGETDEL